MPDHALRVGGYRSRRGHARSATMFYLLPCELERGAVPGWQLNASLSLTFFLRVLRAFAVESPLLPPQIYRHIRAYADDATVANNLLNMIDKAMKHIIFPPGYGVCFGLHVYEAVPS
jgi:hypothetical protein